MSLSHTANATVPITVIWTLTMNCFGGDIPKS